VHLLAFEQAAHDRGHGHLVRLVQRRVHLHGTKQGKASRASRVTQYAAAAGERAGMHLVQEVHGGRAQQRRGEEEREAQQSPLAPVRIVEDTCMRDHCRHSDV